jgi:hypothetical protein
MANRKKELIDTIQKDLTVTELHTFYTANNVVFERVDLFRDFVISLANIIASTYLGDDITSAEQRMKHFDWCWNKNIQNFAEEHIYFMPKGTHYKYFKKYFTETFYDREDKILSMQLIVKFWYSIMSYLILRRQIDLRVFMGMYKMLEDNLVIQ